MKIDTAVEFVLTFVKVHKASSLLVDFVLPFTTFGGGLE
jgi:hypothetical protein